MKTATPELTEVEGNFLLGCIDKAVKDSGVRMSQESFAMAQGIVTKIQTAFQPDASGDTDGN